MKNYSIEIKNRPVYCKEATVKRFYSIDASSYSVAVSKACRRYVKEEKLADRVERGMDIKVRRES